jgi:nucleotidyltransferase/DNA polymerase involved in DNA repair
VLAATRLHCSVGIGDNKIRAKIATGFGKPRGVFRLTAANWFEVMGHRCCRRRRSRPTGSRTSPRRCCIGSGSSQTPHGG